MVPSTRTKQLALKIIVKQFNIVAVTIVAIVASIGWFFVIQPKWSEISGNRNELDAMRAEYKAKQTQLDQAKLTQIDIAKLSDQNQSKLAASIPKSIDKPGLWIYFSAIAEEADLNLLYLDASRVDVSESEEDKGENYQKGVTPILIQMTTEGAGYSKLKKLLTVLEQHVPLTDIKSFSYAPDNEKLELEMEMYILE